jgi:hypothetical protein
MTKQTQDKFRAAEEAVTRLVKECRKDTILYKRSPRAVAQVSLAQYLL